MKKNDNMDANMSNMIETKKKESKSTIKTEQQILRQEMVSLTTNLFRKLDEKISDLNTTDQTEQRLFAKEMVSLTNNLS